MKISFKTLLTVGLTATLSVGLTLSVTNPKIFTGGNQGATIATENGQINSNNTSSTVQNTTNATTTIHNTILVNSEGFAVPGAPVVLRAAPAPDDAALPALSPDEQKKIGRKITLNKGEGASFVNGAFTIGVNTLAEIGGIDYAAITIVQLSPPDFKVKTGWTQDFVTGNGTFRLSVERIEKTFIDIAVYQIN